ncbi:18716_t:CDS:2 [Entrophospora sp. SA101]|nr:18716_t:CDS:2 [Entrophospora sp. SA101]
MSRNFHKVVESQLINFSPVRENHDVELNNSTEDRKNLWSQKSTGKDINSKWQGIRPVPDDLISEDNTNYILYNLTVEEIKDEFNIAKPIEEILEKKNEMLNNSNNIDRYNKIYNVSLKSLCIDLAVNLQFVNNKNLSPYDLKRESISFAAKYLKDEEDKKGESSHAINEEEEKKKETLIRIFDVSESDLKILNQAEFSVHRYYMDLKENLKHQSTQFKSDNLINGITPLANKIADKLQSHWPSLYQKLASNVFPEQVKKLFNTFTMLVINFNTLTDLHHDIKDLDNSLCVVVPLGEFEGGELVFPEINLVVELK